MKLSEVFSPGGYPAHTYNPRKNLELEEKLKDYLDSGFKLLSLSGPTKSGKTVLCQRVIPKKDGIWINGGDIREENDFWKAIVDSLGLYTDITTQTVQEKSTSVSGEVGGEFSLVVVKVGSNLTGGECNSTNLSHQWSRSDNPRTVALRALGNNMRPIIVDDFHYIPERIQINIVRSLKAPIFEGQRVVFISVPHRAYDSVRIESEMAGRVHQLPIPEWGEDELMEIPKKGFPFLNVKIYTEISRLLAKESFGNPQLMQEFCAKICKLNKIVETSPIQVSIPDEIEDEFFITLASNIASKPDYEKLEHGPRQRSDRKKRVFMDGRQGDIYKAVLLGLANTGPKNNIQYEELRSELRTILKGELPQRQQVSTTLIQMQKLSSSSEGRPRIIEWDSDSDTVFILDPYFAFYLRWAIRNSPTNRKGG